MRGEQITAVLGRKRYQLYSRQRLDPGKQKCHVAILDIRGMKDQRTIRHVFRHLLGDFILYALRVPLDKAFLLAAMASPQASPARCWPPLLIGIKLPIIDLHVRDFVPCARGQRLWQKGGERPDRDS